MPRDFLYQVLASIKEEITDEQVDKFALYYRELLAWNKKINLTSLTAEEEVFIKHFYDSLLVMRTKEWQATGKLLDVGSGAGLPGIPLKIMNPGMKIVLLDSLNKRVVFLKHMIDSLQLEGIEAIHGRAEEYGHCENWREGFDFAVARAVAPLPVLLEYCLPFIKKGGSFFAYKGPEGLQEARASLNALQILGGEIAKTYEETLPQEKGKRCLLTIKKTGKTPDKFPRRSGMPEKKPL